ncbi:MAG: hypothetical protein HYU75_21245 [Betaproteobacteria bacterium]|nr:hypothetical protein [Betaproteobacteria bacterium]
MGDQAGRHYQQNSLADAACDQFEQADSRLDGLAEPDIVGNQEASPRTAQKACKRRELIGLR